MLSSYVNVFNTCLVLLQREGYSLAYDRVQNVWTAKRDGFSFLADNPIELLGLTAIYDKIQPQEDSEYWWQINDPQILDELNP